MKYLDLWRDSLGHTVKLQWINFNEIDEFAIVYIKIFLNQPKLIKGKFLC